MKPMYLVSKNKSDILRQKQLNHNFVVEIVTGTIEIILSNVYLKIEA